MVGMDGFIDQKELDGSLRRATGAFPGYKGILRDEKWGYFRESMEVLERKEE